MKTDKPYILREKNQTDPKDKKSPLNLKYQDVGDGVGEFNYISSEDPDAPKLFLAQTLKLERELDQKSVPLKQIEFNTIS